MTLWRSWILGWQIGNPNCLTGWVDSRWQDQFCRLSKPTICNSIGSFVVCAMPLIHELETLFGVNHPIIRRAGTLLTGKWSPGQKELVGHGSQAGFGGIIRHKTGRWVTSFSGRLLTASILHTKLEALRRGLLLAWDRGISRLVCNSDSKLVVNLMVKLFDVHHMFALFIGDILILLARDWHVLVTHTFRECNFSADYLAKTGACGTNTFVVWHSPSVEMRLLLEGDLAGVFSADFSFWFLSFSNVPKKKLLSVTKKKKMMKMKYQ